MAISEHILSKLSSLADTHEFQVLYACETGSRGWGFASPDSDFDVRFVFAYPQARYLSVYEPKDNFTLMAEEEEQVLDLSGWELRKFLRHMSKSNATPLEWLQSPIIYRESIGFRSQLMMLAPDYQQTRTLIHHYLGIAQNSMRLGVVGTQVNIKKYFYVLRPLLAAKWAADHRSIPPMQFRPLLDQLSETSSLRQCIEELWKEKEQAGEAAYTALIPEIQEFFLSEVSRCQQIASSIETSEPDTAPLNQFFQEWLPK